MPVLFGKGNVMKLIKKIGCSVGLLLLSAHSQAAVNVQLSHDIEAVVINGESSFSFFGNDKNLELPNGVNQLVVRVSKLIQGQGNPEKYRSEPMIVTFEAKDSEVKLASGQRILNSTDGENFNDAPSLTVTDENGSPLAVKFDVLKRGGKFDTSAMFSRNYAKEVALYNQKNGYSFVQGVEPIQDFAQLNTTDVDASPKTLVTLDKNSLKALYLQLPTEKRKAFLQWAIAQ